MRTDVKDVDAYLGMQPEHVRVALEQLRQTIKSVVPAEAEEVISYAMPMFKYHGMVAGFAAFKHHYGFYPGAIVQQFKDELKDYKTSKGAIQFSYEKPLPVALVKKIIKARIKENLSRTKK